jgi:uncharacterized membrane protein YphA (DoxX/SURF4 family)
MHIATVVLSVLLAAEFAVIGITKVLDTATARTNASHLGISPNLSRLIGIAELAASVGLLAGLAVKPLAAVVSAGVVRLMGGAIGSHLKVRDKATALLPAVITGLAAVALLALTVAA